MRLSFGASSAMALETAWATLIANASAVTELIQPLVSVVIFLFSS
jgi:hypothetical protein